MTSRHTDAEQRIQSFEFYEDMLGVVRIAIKYDNGQEEDRPATYLENLLADPPRSDALLSAQGEQPSSEPVARYRCERCGEWFNEPMPSGHAVTRMHQRTGEPYPEQCGPVTLYASPQPQGEVSMTMDAYHELLAYRAECLLRKPQGEQYLAGLEKAAEMGLAACTRYVDWYSKGRAQDAGDIAYDLVSVIREMLAAIRAHAASPKEKP